MSSSFGCALCAQDGGTLVWYGKVLRVVHVEEAGFPGYYRVIWNAHVAEFSELSDEARAACMAAVVCVERALIEHLQPAKVNLAALGNMVPHLHWHVIARFEWDMHFPNAIWGPAQRPRDLEQEAVVRAQLEATHADIRAALVKAETPDG
ncbi:MAG: HIT domain-containing protein [Acidovorax sp. SCN 68-22]|nr:MAG: HIT domain-containing protein [Acidovorax sp. SCN 68-22]